MNELKKNLLAAALFLGATGAAQAAALDLGFVQNGPSLELSTSETDRYATGPLQFVDRQGKSFQAFCVELGQDYAETADGWQSYAVGSFAAPQAQALQGLFSTSYAGLSNATQYAAFQVAVWEITHETKSSFGVGLNDGAFYFDSLNTGSAAADLAFGNLVNGYLQSAVSYQGPALYSVNRLNSGVYQDLLTVTAVPEPESYALMLAGLGVVGLLARRRKQRG